MLDNEALIDAMAQYLRGASPEQSLQNWPTLPWVHAVYQRLAAEHVAGPTGISVKAGDGRGIVTCGGGAKYFPSLFVLCNRLRQVRSQLPIEVWYLGEAEMDPTMKRLLEPFGVTFRDAAAEAEKSPVRQLQGWQTKPFCILHSAFQEVLFLDADNAPVHCPDSLFDAPEFTSGPGAVFWPDFFHWIEHPLRGQRQVEHVYSAFGLPLPKRTHAPGTDYEWFGKPVPMGGDYDLTIESGQLLIDKARCWKELSLALWYAQHSEFYFHLVHGDKECFHFAWRKLGTPYALVPTMPDYDEHTAIQFGFDGRPLFEHRNRPDAKWNLEGNPWSRGGKLKVEPIGLYLMEQLQQQWSGKVWRNMAPTPEETEIAAQVGGRPWMYHRLDHDVRLMEFLADGTIGTGAEKNERYWSVFIIDGKPRVAICGNKEPTAFLEQREDGTWAGRWLIHERCEIELLPVKGRKARSAPSPAEVA